MARIHYWQYILDNDGKPLKSSQVRVYLSGTINEANIYLNADFGSFTTSSVEDLKSNEYGFFEFWIGDIWEVEGGYSVDQQFKVVWQNDVDGIQEEIDDIFIFAPVRPITVSNSVKGDPKNKDFNKVISNNLGYKWENHVDSIIPSASPHNLEPVELFDLDKIKRKVISNKLGYQMWQMSNKASTTSVDVSAARYFQKAVLSFNFDVNEGLYYADLLHNFNNYYPIVKVSDFNKDFQIRVEKVEAISPNTTRIWTVNGNRVRVVIIG